MLAVRQALVRSATSGGADPADAAVRQVLTELPAAHTVLVFRSAGSGFPTVPESVTLIGCTTSGVLGAGHEVESGSSAAALALAGDEIRPRGFNFVRPDDGPGAVARACEDESVGAALLFADGYSAHPDRLADAVAGLLPRTLPLAGLLSSGANGPGPAFRVFKHELSSQGAAGVVLAGRPAIVATAQGCRPVGPTLRVTRAEGNRIAELDGTPALAAFRERAAPFADNLAQATRTIVLAVPAHGRELDQHEFLVRGVVGFVPESGVLGVSEAIEVGTPVRFAVRDAAGARENLKHMLAHVQRRLEGRRPSFGLYFACAGRGQALFGVGDHDISQIHGALGDFPLVGAFAAGELGPVNGRTRLQLFSGVLVVFR